MLTVNVNLTVAVRWIALQDLTHGCLITCCCSKAILPPFQTFLPILRHLMILLLTDWWAPARPESSSEKVFDIFLWNPRSVSVRFKNVFDTFSLQNLISFAFSYFWAWKLIDTLPSSIRILERFLYSMRGIECHVWHLRLLRAWQAEGFWQSKEISVLVSPVEPYFFVIGVNQDSVLSWLVLSSSSW